MKIRKNSAFTLIEVIIGVAILSVVLTAMTSLTLSSINANQANINRLTAYYLAQEGLEGMRNMRDSNWLQNYTYNTGASFWGTNFDQDGFYVLDYLPSRGNSSSPWKLAYFSDKENEASVNSLLYRVEDNFGHNFYLHDSSFASSVPSNFHRYLQISNDPDAHDWFEVKAVVFWEDHGVEKKIEVSTDLANWRKGPI
ncbi:MAG: hypothetical protein UT55_C0068G0008 [Candidatus Peregrinibacteria bacterium GW2011_GWE2_39_6]|nr:MAG: hypothetical protein UT55_C0068G0008 [Candidatus Peregrinibacteria bacterium GW2011_GWE2_39_6]